MAQIIPVFATDKTENDRVGMINRIYLVANAYYEMHQNFNFSWATLKPLLLLFVFISTGACSLRSMAINTIVPTLGNPAVYQSEKDPDLVREALPFLLKTAESLLESSPEQPDGLLLACTGFTLYASAFLEMDARAAEWEDYSIAEELNTRAVNMYVRARDYCLRRVELDYPGITAKLRFDPENAVTTFDKDDVETMYYLGGSWGLAIANGLDQPALAADLPAVRALMVRALSLDESYNRGALHAAMITLESLPEVMGGSPERARQHFARAVELSSAMDASPYVVLASSVSVETQNRAEFEGLLNDALAIDVDKDPSNRLLNVIAQKRARLLLEHTDDLFFDPLPQDGEEELR